MAINSTKFGPGVFELGETATKVVVSCQLTKLVLSAEKEKADALRVLCGDSEASSTAYTYQLEGTIVQDLAVKTGVVAYSWTNKGKSVAFTFTPNTEAKAVVTGKVTVDPLNIGGEEFGKTMTSDFTWAIDGEPTVNIPGPTT